MPIRVTQKGQPYPGEMQAAFEYAYQPLLPPNQVQPPITPDYGAWAARNAQLLNGLGQTSRPKRYPTMPGRMRRRARRMGNVWRAGRPMAPTAAPIWHGLGALQPHPPTQAMFAPFPLQGAVQFQQGSPASRHIPSAQRVMQDAYQQPHSRAPRLYGPSLAQALGDVYRW